MNSKQAREKGYSFTGSYSWDKEEMEARAQEERDKGNCVIVVNVPPSQLSRGHHGMGYSVYIIKSPENIKAEKIKFLNHNISQIKCRLKKKRQEIEELDNQLNEALMQKEEESGK